MTMIIYNKLVRDKIPDIIRAEGKRCHIEALDPQRWLEELTRKLGEEVTEYVQSGDIVELVDLVEVVYSILAARGVTPAEFEALRVKKREARGGFEERVFLVGVE